ncbi:L,D-transpeptidase family protein [Rhabdochromatium marinum]|uniref:L,D-transpeptidase family protein n=1 Tax=Rhabdochromatium marinum TaxID=48729 RepID=UPI001F5B6DDB|nr:L,D-transpeptidase family protein [Rhabdochromatium marinum]
MDVFVLLLTLIGSGGCATKPPPQPDFADQVVVRKEARTLQLLNNGRVFREYRINLGDAPRGHKIQEGDERTPEGDYWLDWRNPNSRFYKSIHVSYPNQADQDFARMIGVSPGGMIMIHGRPNWLTPGPLMKDYDELDWTDGCIAVSNEAMDEIWRKVRDNTPISILP